MNGVDIDLRITQPDWTPTMYSLFEDDSSSSAGSPNTPTFSLKASESEDNDPDTEEKLCSVCGDKANGYHFHVLTCEGCKGFFRRSVSKGLHFTCPFTRSCPITKAKRRRCQACRLHKCFSVGMRKDMIMSEQALAERRALRSRKKQERQSRREPGPALGALTEEQLQLVSLLSEAQLKHFDPTLSNFKHYRPQPLVHVFVYNNHTIPSPAPFPTSGLFPDLNLSDPKYKNLSANPQLISSGSFLPDVLNDLPHFADLSTYMIQQVIQFAKEIPAFRALPMEDQISLLKGSSMEVAHVQFNRVYNIETNVFECGKHKFSIRHGVITGFQEMYLEPMMKFQIMLRKLNLHEEEYALIEALCLFAPDRPGVVEHDIIDEMQENLALTLKCYMDLHHPPPEGRFLYPKLLSLLTELRTLNEEYTRQILHIQDISSENVTPLMKEILF
ncbi:hypothetical protein XENTR_v10022704 [Xenopus tropicalis]|nr:nuclear receptor subfamily 1 group I member 3 isoform X2 [Xenopus tropicalis]KAE8588705.1 hypothetical protein XENTR_v10022704 [Xenopus tropicalis]KAE8588706.1 hypothetical protein XENTR_v10022704 [Xenopus tropicalis]